MNITDTIEAKSDQLNADDLIGRTLTIRVTNVLLQAGEQPCAVHFVGDNGKPYKPGKSMRRVLVHVWGPDAAKYAGRSMTLYRDDDVQFGGLKVGGIRISHMTDISEPVTMALTAKKGSKKAFKVLPLRVEAPPPPMTLAEWGAALQADLNAAQTAEAVDVIAARDDVRKALAEAPQKLRERINAMVKAAIDRTAGPDKDGDLGQDAAP